jgi:hypothetical protein
MMVPLLLIKVEGVFMKIFFLVLLFSASVFGQSSYSSADQDTQLNEEGTHLDSGYSNKDVENKDVKFSGSIDNTAPMSQNQEEPRELSSGKNATRKRAKSPLED